MDFDESIRIARTPGAVFALLADVQDWAVGPGSPVTTMEKLPPGPTRVGTRWREVVRVARGLSMTMWSEATDVVPDQLLALRFWGTGMKGSLTYTLTACAEGTLLRQQETMHMVGWLRPLDALVGRMLEPRLTSRLRDIRDTLEGPDCR